MKTSCGVIILNEYNELFMGHSTGNKFYDIPKGLLDEGENELECALRECMEETSIDLKGKQLGVIGLLPYNKEKNLYLYVVSMKKIEINIESLVCNSFFEDFYSKKMKPEVDEFKWISLDELTQHCAKSMGLLLNKLKNQNLLNYNEKDVNSIETNKKNKETNNKNKI